MDNFTEQDLQEFLDISAVWGKNGSKELYDRACQFIMAFQNFMQYSPKKWGADKSKKEE